MPDTADGSLIRLFVDHQLSVSWAKSHRKNDAEFRVAAEHARVGLFGSFQWVGFDHSLHALQFREAQSILPSTAESAGPALMVRFPK